MNNKRKERKNDEIYILNFFRIYVLVVNKNDKLREKIEKRTKESRAFIINIYADSLYFFYMKCQPYSHRYQKKKTPFICLIHLPSFQTRFFFPFGSSFFAIPSSNITKVIFRFFFYCYYCSSIFIKGYKVVLNSLCTFRDTRHTSHQALLSCYGCIPTTHIS
jgi:hypothetical protein